MNGHVEMARELVGQIAFALRTEAGLRTRCDVVVCPPALYIGEALQAANGSGLNVGAQDCSEHDSGAYTGNNAAAMLKDVGATHVILGHSERRDYHGETDALVRAKAAAAHKAGIVAIICVGEKESERDAGTQNDVVATQLKASLPESATAENTVIAYEPVWAIGTGKTASPDDVAEMHGFIRALLEEQLADGAKIRILYGGSMKPDNAAALLSTANVDGGLIGGASLDAKSFLAIGNAAP